MTAEVFTRHYTAVADASPVPVLLYNVTMFTGVNLPVDAVAALAAHPNIVGMKESGSDLAQIAEYVARTPDDFTVLAGSATTYFHALCAGCDGGILALASLFPDDCVRLQTLVRASRIELARALQAPPHADRAHHRHRARRAGAQGRARPARLCGRAAAAAAAARAGRRRRDPAQPARNARRAAPGSRRG